jgi:hypothetical protein
MKVLKITMYVIFFVILGMTLLGYSFLAAVFPGLLIKLFPWVSPVLVESTNTVNPILINFVRGLLIIAPYGIGIILIWYGIKEISRLLKNKKSHFHPIYPKNRSTLTNKYEPENLDFRLHKKSRFSRKSV